MQIQSNRHRTRPCSFLRPSGCQSYPTCSDEIRWLVLIGCSGEFMFYLPSYAGAFRCIGQELQSQNIEVFELRSHADEFRLQCGDPNPPYTGLIEMLFSKEKIQMIDREGRRRRGQLTGEIRFDSIPKYFVQWGNTSTEKAVI